MNSGQYQSQVVDYLEIQKGITLKYPVSANSDIRGCLLFGEIRRAIPGKQASNFTVSTKAGFDSLEINATRTAFGTDGDRQIRIKKGDRVDIEGAGIIDAEVVAVSGRAIYISQPAQRNLRETEIVVKSPVTANFTFAPKNDLYRITTTSGSQKSATSVTIGGSKLLAAPNQALIFNEYKSLTVTRIPSSIRKNTVLVFNKNGVAVDVKLSTEAVSGSTNINTYPISEQIPAGCSATIGASVAIAREPVRKRDTKISVRPLKIAIAKNTILNFGYKDEKGWRQTGYAVVSQSTLENSLSIPIFPYSQNTIIPANSVAYFGNVAVTNFYLILDPSESSDILSGNDYGCDIISASWDGEVKKIAQITKINFTDTWTDLT